MKSFVNVMLVVLLMTSFAAVACGEWVYVSHRSASYGDLDRYDGSGTYDQTYVAGVRSPDGICLSPDNGTVYMAANGNDRVYSYNAETGVAGTVYTMPDKPRGLAVDPSTGYVYCSHTGNGSISRINTSTGVVSVSWGTGPGSAIDDIEIYDGKIYGGGTGSNLGVYTWDLATGGASTLVAGTGSTRCDGVAIDPTDGTLYTSNYAVSYNVVKWTAGVSTEIYNFGNPPKGPIDIDYFNGYIYTAGYLDENIGKIDLADNSYSVLVDFSGTSKPRTRFLAVVEIPEPGTLALLATGLIGLLCYAWRKRK